MASASTFDSLWTNGTVWTPGGPVEADIGVTGGKVAAILPRGQGSAGKTRDCAGRGWSTRRIWNQAPARRCWAG